MLQLAVAAEPKTCAEMFARYDAARRRLGAPTMRFPLAPFGQPCPEVPQIIAEARARVERDAREIQRRAELRAGRTTHDTEVAAVKRVIDIYRSRLEANPLAARVKLVIALTADEFELPVEEMTGPSRSLRICRPRFIAMALARRITGKPTPEIGRQFGGRDHTTVVNAVAKTRRVFADVFEGPLRPSNCAGVSAHG